LRPAHRKSSPRHLAGSQRAAWAPREIDADFDVVAALDEESDFDFEALFAGDLDPADAPKPKARIARHKVAFAVSITLAAIPLLVLDNFQATAEPSDGTKVEASVDRAAPEADISTTNPIPFATTEVPPVDVDVTIAKATVFVAQPTTTTTAAAVEKAAPSSTTPEKPAPTTTTTEKPAPTTTVAAAAAPSTSSKPDPNDDATWDRLAKCESNGNWQAVSEPRNGMTYYGGLQFSLATWQGLGGTGLPSDAPRSTQIAMGKKLQARQGWNAWPTCARSLGWS
jgi:hypothetical protein